MKRSVTMFAIIAAVIVLLGLLLAGSYNGLVTSRESVRGSINNLQSQYQRRADLVPNLVNTVKGSADFEKSTLESVINARAKATQVRIDPSNATPEQLNDYQNAQGELSQALGRLLAVAENYPDLKSTAAFQDLMTQLEGTENRIQVARADYGKTALAYNTKIQRFPTNISAAVFGFETFPYFASDQGAEKAPTVDFNPGPKIPQPAPTQ